MEATSLPNWKGSYAVREESESELSSGGLLSDFSSCWKNGIKRQSGSYSYGIGQYIPRRKHWPQQ